MTSMKCPECGKEADGTTAFCIYCGHYPLVSNGEQRAVVIRNTNTSPKRSKKKTHILTIMVCTAIAAIFAYKILDITKTSDSKNGWKHQTGHFGVCDFDESDDCGEATHRIQSASASYVAGAYCDEHWSSYGADFFKRLVAKGASNNSSNDDNSSEVTTAKVCAEKAVKDMLKAPATAKFCSYTEMTATNLGGNRWEVSGYVDAENSFGATLRQNWTVKLTLTDTGFKDYTVDFS